MPYSLNLPDAFNAADHFVDRNVREGRGEKVAVLCEDRSFTYADIQAGMNRFGNALKSLGVRMEERVSLLLLDTEVYPQAFFGAIKAGAVPVCLNTMNRTQDFQFYLNDSRSRVLVVDAPLLEQIEPIRGSLPFLEHVIVVGQRQGGGQHTPHAASSAVQTLRPADLDFDELLAAHSDRLDTAPTCRDDACFWLYSSGSTGSPKGTVHLQHDMVYAASTYGIKVLDIREDDVFFSAAKLFFAYGLGNGIYFPFHVGATAVYLPQRPTPEQVYATVRRHRPTLFFGVPTLYGQMLEQEGTMPGVRLCVSAGEALPPAYLHRWKARFQLDILDGIGSTEMAHIFVSNRPGEITPGSSGKVVPGYEARIVDESMHDVSPGEIGTLLVKGDSAAAYYWNKHGKTSETMMGQWLNTGDKYYCDHQGYFFCAGRSDDMLKVGGIWVSPNEVEACLIEHPDVLECAVIGACDEDDLVKPMAFVVLGPAKEPSEQVETELKEFVKSSLALYKYPRWIRFMDELPKTATGKIKRFELRNLLQQQQAA
ncbi:benzoate-CoA ligase family protein [Geomonas anaerohicana]|uniref:Benzoate-CoA ligase family protein n=1 Tax=Geomonas anaerohicana TaxID=2798583 RepID=A0ABS0YB50_9BACT|nr:benzoate-CoA ligase family protein [Geomonas anaerohicana]MBJ6749512.1 benzoate-CoA ligase family protein [Geomonas anaerohicana]